MPQEKMSIHDAQKHAMRWVKDLRAAKTLEGVCDAVVDAEDRIGTANLHVENARKEVEALVERGLKLEAENSQLLLDQEDIHRKAKVKAEALETHMENVNKRVDELNAWHKETTEDIDKEVSVLVAEKQKLEAEVAVLQTEKDHIETVVSAFQAASAGREKENE